MCHYLPKFEDDHGVILAASSIYKRSIISCYDIFANDRDIVFLVHTRNYKSALIIYFYVAYLSHFHSILPICIVRLI